ncbi:MAG: AI-2E family transporter [Chitinophagales bacterium]|nr:AI-2E family transporter [Chitinophagales bacterium]
MQPLPVLILIMGSHFNQPDLVPNTLDKLQDWLVGAFPIAIIRLIGIFLRVLVMYFVLFFLFIHHENFEETLLKYVPFPEKNAVLLSDELKNITFASVVGHGMIACTQGLLLGIGFLIFGISNPLFWGVIAMLLAFIPLVGPPAIFIPAGLVIISLGNVFSGIGIIIYGLIVVGVIEYFIRFFISQKLGKIHPLITVAGLIIGLPLFGIIGLVIGPLLVSYFFLFITLYESDYVKKITIRRKPR